MVKHLTHNPEIEGSNAAIGSKVQKNGKKFVPEHLISADNDR